MLPPPPLPSEPDDDAEFDPDLQPRPIAGQPKEGGTIQTRPTGPGGPGGPEPPEDLVYPPGPHRLRLGQAMTPLVPTYTGSVDRFYVTPPLPNAVVPSIALAASPRSGLLFPTNPEPILYKPDEYTLPVGFARLDVYLPAGAPPTDGWPVLLTNRVAGWFGAPRRGSIDPNDDFAILLHKAINAGLAVLDVGANGSGTPGSPALPAWFYPPGHPSGRWENENQVLPDKDLLHAIQWTRDQQLWPLDAERIFALGLSAGAQIPMWIAFHPELAVQGGSSQIARPSSIAGVVALDPITSFLAQQDDWPIANPRYESVSQPGTDALDLADADQAIRDVSSPMRALLAGTSRGHGVACFFACDETIENPDFSLESDGHPALRDTIGEPNIHDLWNCAMMLERLRDQDDGLHIARSELWVPPGADAALGPLQGLVTGTFSGILASGAGVGAFWDEVVRWLVARATEERPIPHGLELHPATGIVHGTPNTLQGPRQHVVLASNENGSANASFVLEVGAP